ncbi:MAG TPA: DUF971 domain-containing protein [Polyangiaceae bacterium]|jgi:DUF971 family protein
MTDPKHIAKAIRSPRGARTTEIDWADGHKGIYPHAILRGYCPCAGCQGHSGTISFIEHADMDLEIDELAPVGNYALQITWSDRHDSGIYSYAYLRSLCQCEACHGPHGETIPR